MISMAEFSIDLRGSLAAAYKEGLSCGDIANPGM